MMASLLQRVRQRLGDFWWWSLIMFCALRVGDVINAFVGIWLVPKYVPQSELGAVLPLVQVTSSFGLPISILVVIIMKFLNLYKTKGELGKVKMMIRVFWGFTVVATLLGTGVALLLMPHFFERIRVAQGSLGVLIIATAVLGTTAPVFTNAMQALKKFREISIMNLCTAPIRLAVMLVAMPFRALSGYMLGQAAPSAFQILWSCFVLRKDIRNDVRAEPFWKNGEWKPIARFAAGVSISMLTGTGMLMAQTLIVRQRLPEVESAAYYMISRFAEIGMFLSQTVSFVLFPLAAEQAVNRSEQLGLFLKAAGASVGFGCLVAVFFAVVGPLLTVVVPLWGDYAPYLPDLVLLTAVYAVGCIPMIWSTYECAAGRFGYLWYMATVMIVYSAVLVGFTGCEFFRGTFPDGVVDWMASFRLGTLRNFILFYLVYNVVQVVFIAGHLLRRRAVGRPPAQ